MTPEEILLKAAEDQAAHGHCKQSFYETLGEGKWETASACALGSIARVTGDVHRSGIVQDPVGNFAAHLLAEQIRKSAGFPLSTDDYLVITTFNDDDRTTGEDVVLAMKRAAAGE